MNAYSNVVSKSGVLRPSPVTVRQFHQVLLWPLRLLPVPDAGGGRGKPWELLAAMGDASPWREVVDEFTGTADQFHERHYTEFVTFLPYVQRFLFGEGRSRHTVPGDMGEAPMRVFRRTDVAQVRMAATPQEAALTLDIVHADLYFFPDVDLVFLNLEISGKDLSLHQAQEMLHRFGRGYPAGWDAQGLAAHCMASVEWLAQDGRVLARSDSQQRDLFLAHVAKHRAPRIASHWAFMLEPLVNDYSDQEGVLRYRQIEYYRMPVMGYLAVDDPRQLTRSDFVRLGLVAGGPGHVGSESGTASTAERAGFDEAMDAGMGSSMSHTADGLMPTSGGAGDRQMPYAEHYLSDFESRICYDRFWGDVGAAPHTRYLCSGHALIVVGQAQSVYFGCRDRGVLSQFRHPHFMLFLIAHFQKAALLMFSDALVEALRRLDIRSSTSVRKFKRAIRGSFENFLGFTHRYWFHEVAEQAQSRALFKMCATHLGLDPLYEEVKERIADMNSYLDADSYRRQANTVVRLTVVTIFGLIGTVTTGFLGMNLMAEADAPMPRRIAIFSVVFVITTALTVYTMAKSKRLSDFLDALSDERLSTWQKCKSLVSVWRNSGD